MKILITTGPAYAPIDEVRRITNFSTGELGALLATAAAEAGHQVICARGQGATHPAPPSPVITESFTILAMVIVGGVGTLIGPVFGAILLTLLPELLRGIGDLRLVVYGVALTLVVLFMPGGLVQAARLIHAKLTGAPALAR